MEEAHIEVIADWEQLMTIREDTPLFLAQNQQRTIWRLNRQVSALLLLSCYHLMLGN